MPTAIEGAEELLRCDQILSEGPGEHSDVDYRQSCAFAQAMRGADLAWRRELAGETVADVRANVEHGHPEAPANIRARIADLRQDVASRSGNGRSTSIVQPTWTQAATPAPVRRGAMVLAERPAAVDHGVKTGIIRARMTRCERLCLGLCRSPEAVPCIGEPMWGRCHEAAHYCGVRAVARRAESRLRSLGRVIDVGSRSRWCGASHGGPG